MNYFNLRGLLTDKMCVFFVHPASAHQALVQAWEKESCHSKWREGMEIKSVHTEVDAVYSIIQLNAVVAWEKRTLCECVHQPSYMGRRHEMCLGAAQRSGPLSNFDTIFSLPLSPLITPNCALLPFRTDKTNIEPNVPIFHHLHRTGQAADVRVQTHYRNL